MNAILALEDGSVFHGQGFGAPAQACGEVCFNTSMTGYQEILTDPSYKGQIVTMTWPLIGNYGVNEQDVESWQPHVAGFAIRELSPVVSNWRAQSSLAVWLEKNGIPGIQGIDTRALTKKLRVRGALNGFIAAPRRPRRRGGRPRPRLARLGGRGLRARKSPTKSPFFGMKTTTQARPLNWRAARSNFHETPFHAAGGHSHRGLRLRDEIQHPAPPAPARLPRASRARHHHGRRRRWITSRRGFFLSNGPGDPSALGYAVQAARDLVDHGIPIFGICLGHQILGQAFGGKTFKLKFGHRGANQPVKDLESGKVEITAQNHGFAVDPATLPSDVVVDRINLNDQDRRRIPPQDQARFLRAVPSRSLPRPARLRPLFAQFRELIARS